MAQLKGNLEGVNAEARLIFINGQQLVLAPNVNTDYVKFTGQCDYRLDNSGQVCFVAKPKAQAAPQQQAYNPTNGYVPQQGGDVLNLKYKKDNKDIVGYCMRYSADLAIAGKIDKDDIVKFTEHLVHNYNHLIQKDYANIPLPVIEPKE